MILSVNDLFNGCPRSRHKIIDGMRNLDGIPQRRRRDQDSLIRDVHVMYLGIHHCADLVLSADILCQPVFGSKTP
jgi:hypothetical protein